MELQLILVRELTTVGDLSGMAVSDVKINGENMLTAAVADASANLQQLLQHMQLRLTLILKHMAL